MTRFLHPAQGEPPRRLPRARPRRVWPAVAVAIAATVGVVVALLGLTPTVAGSGGVDPDTASGYGLEVAPEPSTPPATAVPESAPPSTIPAATPGTAPVTTAPEVPVTSARFEDLERSSAPIPVGLRIPAIGVDAPIIPVGYAGGEMEVPSTAAEVGWYEYGPAPGAPGSSVLAAHVAWRGEAGVFFDLVDLPPGALIEVQFDDGSTRLFESVALTSYGKQDLPVGEVFRRDGPAVVTLITCGGAFNPSLRSYEDNIVALAVEVTDTAYR